MTRRVGLLGKPLKRRHSQVMHDAAFDAAGIDARYVLLEMEPEAVEPAVAEARGDGWLGLGVTAPYKRVVAGLVDEVEAGRRAIGAVNNVVRTTTAGWSASTPMPPASGLGWSWRWADRCRALTSSSWVPAAPRMRSCMPAPRGGAPGDDRKSHRADRQGAGRSLS